MAVRRSAASALPACVAATLLRGHGAWPPGGAICHCPDGATCLALALYDIRPEDLWQRHEQELRATAAAWGWEPTIVADGQRRFFAEAEAAGVPEPDMIERVY